ncbi:MAG: OsmC family protein [Anaerolineae bacterium]
MAALDNYFERKSAAIAERQRDWTVSPEKAVATVKAQSKVAGITGARPIQMGDYTIITDSGPGLAGHTLGPTSPELLLGALASCLVHTYLIQATLQKIPLDDVQINISGTLDYKSVVGMSVDQIPAIRDIEYEAKVESPAPAETIAKLHEIVEVSCPVLNTLRHPTNIRRVME